jgi:hypothetical protein
MEWAAEVLLTRKLIKRASVFTLAAFDAPTMAALVVQPLTQCSSEQWLHSLGSS